MIFDTLHKIDFGRIVDEQLSQRILTEKQRIYKVGIYVLEKDATVVKCNKAIAGWGLPSGTRKSRLPLRRNRTNSSSMVINNGATVRTPMICGIPAVIVFWRSLMSFQL
jgi:hypothetical protein